MREERARIDGVSMRWEERGDGRAVVLLHGVPTSPALWRKLVDRIGSVRALAWEMVGYGASWREGEGRDISLEAQARYLARWLDALGVTRAVLVGHDLGGGVAQIAAVNDPGRCAGLVLANAVSYDSWPIPSVRLMKAAPGVVERMPPKVLRVGFTYIVRRGHDDQAVASESIPLHFSNYDHERGGVAFARQIRSLRTKDTLQVAPRLPDLNVPAAVVWGAADRFQKVRYGRRLAADLNAQLDEIEGGKHFVPEDHPERVAAAVTSVVSRSRE